MNCKQAEELLPLYVSDDLAEKRARLVTQHLQNCNACAVVLDEHRQAHRLLQVVGPQNFGEGDFNAIRQEAWRRIKAKSPQPALTQLIAGWFSPRIAWAAAAAVMILAVIGGIYFVTKRNPEKRDAAVLPAPIEYPVVPAPQSNEKPPARQAYNSKPGRGGIKYRSRVRSEAPESIAAKVRPPASVKPNESGPPVTQNSSRLTRMEIQTRDPNIRIIWFAQPN